jgi:hypothetical protein
VLVKNALSAAKDRRKSLKILIINRGNVADAAGFEPVRTSLPGARAL